MVEGALLGSNNIKIKNIYNLLVARSKKEGFELPSYRTIVSYYRNFEKNNKAQTKLARNPDGFKSQYMLAIGSYSEEAVEPNYIWEIDSTPADIMLKEGRCTILGCIDVHTRRVKFLVQKSSNSLGITSLIRNCILDWGVPRIIKSDNGADYKSKRVEIALKVLEIEQRFVTPYSGWEKPFVERIFRTTQHSHLELHKDFIGHNLAERKAIESVNSFAEGLLKKKKYFPSYGIEDLQHFLDIWVRDYYLDRPHDGLKKYVKQNKLKILPTPNSMLQYNIAKGFKALEPVSIRDLDRLLEPLKGKRTIGKKGIWVDNIAYFEPNPMAMMVGQEVLVRVDQMDMGKIYVFDERHNFICEAINYEKLGDSKVEFIRRGKAIQGELTKQLKRNTRSLINKSKGLPNYGHIQIDLEEAIAELSEIFYAVANIKDDYLVFISKENTKELEIDIEDILSIVKQDASNKYYNGVMYNSWNIKEARLESTRLGEEPYLILASAVDESIKNSYINSKYKEIQEKEYINISLKQGNPNLQAGFNFKLNSTESYSQFNGTYRIEKVIHKYNNTFVTSVWAVKIN